LPFAAASFFERVVSEFGLMFFDDRQSMSSLFPFPGAPSRKSADRVVRKPMTNDGAKHRAMANHRERLSISRQQVILAAITLAAAILRCGIRMVAPHSEAGAAKRQTSQKGF